MPDDKRFTIDDENGASAECSLAEMLEANAEDEELVEALRQMQPGEARNFGGGAAPITTITRVL